MTNVAEAVASVVITSLTSLVAFLPQFVGGLIVILIGLIIATFLRELVLRVFTVLKIEDWFRAAGDWFKTTSIEKKAGETVWPGIFAELVRWTILILFLIPAVEAWGLPRVTDVLNQVLFYLPNVFVVVVVGFVGLVVANLVYDVVQGSTKGLGSSSSSLLASVGRYAIIFFTALVVLNQLGVASDLIRILFTGIVVMLALAGGIAFGLGGQETARQTINDLRDKLGAMEVKGKEVRYKGRVTRRS